MTGMFVVIGFMGLLCLVMGFLVKKYPQMITGYDKDNPPTDEALTHVKYALIVAGVVTIVGGCTSYLLDAYFLMGVFIFTPIMLAGIYSVSRFNNKHSKWKTALFVAVLLGLYVFMAYSLREPSVEVDQQHMSISGIYGETIPLENIKKVSLLDESPRIGMRTNGFALGDVLKGYFKVEGIGRAKLLINSLEAPFLRIETVDGILFVNFEDSAKTLEIYDKLSKSYQAR